MSKRILTVVLVLGTLVTSNAFASRARDLVLGTGDAGVILGNGGSSGTFYTDDAYNMFYNPAYVSDYKNWAIIEKSNFSTGAANTTSTTLGGTPTGTVTTNNGATAQGGFVTGLGNFTLGLFFNRQDAIQDALYVGGQSTMRPIDLLIGGDLNNIKWGLGLTYAGYNTADPSTTGATKMSNDWTVRAGVSFMDLEPFIDWRFHGTDNSIALAPTNKAFTGGLRYHWGEWTPYALYKNESYNSVTDYRAFGIGLGRTMKATESVKLMYNVAFFRQVEGFQNLASVQTGATAFTNYIGGQNGTGTAGDRSVIPLNIAVEGDANSWLTLRAGLGYNLMDRVNSVTVADNTSGRIGATAHAGKVDVDFAVGAGGNGAETANATSTQNFDFTSGLFTAASLQYHW